MEIRLRRNGGKALSSMVQGFKGLKRFFLPTVYCLLSTVFLGCGLAEKALVTLIAPNPELKRLEAQKETTSEGIEAVKDPAVDKEKAKQIVRLVESSQRQGHPSFFGAVVSGLYTEEGRRLAGLAVVALASLGAMGWKMAQATLLGRALDATISGVQEYRNTRPDGGQELKTILSRRHKGLPVDMARRVARVLKET